MPHDAQTYVPTYTKTPAQTQTEVLSFLGNIRAGYERAFRTVTRQYETATGQPDGFLPVLTSLSPNTKVQGAAAFTLTANGSNFTKASRINWAGQYLSTLYVSSTQLTADIPASLVQAAATVPVKVYTDSSVSSTVTFTISATVREGEPTDSWTKAEIVAWLLANGSQDSDTYLNNQTKTQLLDLVADVQPPA